MLNSFFSMNLSAASCASFQAFFAGGARYPRYKSRRGRQAGSYTRSAFRWRDGQLWLAKTSAPLRLVWSWPNIDPATLEPTGVTVSRDPEGTRTWVCPCGARHDRAVANAGTPARINVRQHPSARSERRHRRTRVLRDSNPGAHMNRSSARNMSSAV